MRPHGRKGPLGSLMTASLDHALWFHRPCRVDEWLLYAQDSPAAGGAHGYARGSIYANGVRVTSVAQEGLMRPIAKPEGGEGDPSDSGSEGRRCRDPCTASASST